MTKRARKPHDLYATRDGAMETIYIWLGKPSREETDCENCGNKHSEWSPHRGARVLLEDVCDEGFQVSGIVIPPNGCVKFKILAEET